MPAARGVALDSPRGALPITLLLDAEDDLPLPDLELPAVVRPPLLPPSQLPLTVGTAACCSDVAAMATFFREGAEPQACFELLVRILRACSNISSSDLVMRDDCSDAYESTEA